MGLNELGVVDAAALIASREVTVTELTEACLARIRAVDGTHSHDGDPGSINAWIRVYEDDAMAAAASADTLVAGGGELPPLLGVPVGLKDLYAVAGKPVTASSSLLDDVPDRDCDVWAGLRAAGMILLGHLHTHEFAAGGTTDQVGNPWELARSAGGSSGGSAAALAARMVPAATGTDTAGSLRIPSACCGTSTIKPTRGLLSTRGIVPLSWSLDHPGPMARSLADCRALLAAMVGTAPPSDAAPGVSIVGARIAISPRIASVTLDGDVSAGLRRAVYACTDLGAVVVEPPAPDAGFDVGDRFLDVMTTDMLAYHRRFDGRRDRYRPALREWIEMGESRSVSGERYASLQAGRVEMTAAWIDWLREHRISAVIEPTIPTVAPLRGEGYGHAGSDYDMISLTHFWDWTGFPVVSLPAGQGPNGALPVGVSLVGAPGDEWRLLDLGIALQGLLGTPTWP
jgi:aspartyl-tRNA(Asn)/glutamyl-tRNA(Gln) amidotransferase subunit A